MRRLTLLLAVASLALAACQAFEPQPKTTLPPANAHPSDIVAAYLQSLVDGDCAKARALTTQEELSIQRPLCDEPRVTGFSELSCQGSCGDPPEAIYAVELTIRGASAVGLPEGANPMHIQVVFLPTGIWRVNNITKAP